MATGVERLGRFRLGIAKVDATLGSLALAALTAIPVFHAPAALLFLASGIGLALWRPRATVSELLEARSILVLPLFCLLSVIWSLYPGLTLRFALQLTATFVIAVLISYRLPYRMALVAIFFALSGLVVSSIVAGPYRADTGALVGLYGSKNEMAGMSALLALAGLGLAVWREVSISARIMGILGFLLGTAAIVLAQSTGALGYLPVGIFAMVSAKLLARLGLSTRMTGVALSLVLMVLLGVVLAARFDLFAEAFFEITGKDITLTGRVELWEVALNLIAERPLLGTGYQAFWVPGHPPAEALWEAFGIASRSGFNFHNTYLSNAVEIGLVGLVIEVFLIASALILSGRLAIRSGDGGACLMFGIATFMTAMTVFEAPVFFQFSLQSVLYVLIILWARKGLRHLRHR